MQMSNQFARFKFSWLGVNNNFDRGCCYLRLCYRQRRRTFFTIKRQVPGTVNKFAEIYRSDSIIQRASPNFSLPYEVISLMTLCNCNKDAKIRFSVYVDWRNTLIQDVCFTINEIEAMKGKKIFRSPQGASLEFQNFEVYT